MMFTRFGLPLIRLCRIIQQAKFIHPYSTTVHDSTHICIVGSGPAGFYTAQQLLKGNKSVHVDIYEKLPVPFGLVRFGVAPDHPEVKNVISTFTQTASNERCTFLGNVNVGVDITVEELRAAYTAVVMCYGADSDKRLGIPGEDLANVVSAREFVGWYNGVPEHRHLDIDLDTNTAVILGQGNVALDMARVILTPISQLAKTDITQYSLRALERSAIKQVYIVGRRGPLQVAFTIKELREMTKLPDCQSLIDPSDFTGLYSSVDELPRPRRRLTQLMYDTATQPQAGERQWLLKFLRSPSEVLSRGGVVSGVRLTVNELQGEKGKEKAVPTSQTEDIACGLVIRSVGYKGQCINGGPSFDHSRGTFHSHNGHIGDTPDMYCSGWIRRGADGVILTTMNDAFEVGKQIVADIESGTLVPRRTSGKHDIMATLVNRGVHVVTFDDWQKIHLYETQQGQMLGKPQEKVTDVARMLDIVSS